MAFRSRADVEDAPYFSLYIITRVNRKIYAYIEVIEPGGTQDPEQIAAIQEPQVEDASVSSACELEVILQQLREQGSVILPGDRLSIERSFAGLVRCSVSCRRASGRCVCVCLSGRAPEARKGGL